LLPETGPEAGGDVDIIGHYTRAEIESQPEAWTASLKVVQDFKEELRSMWCLGRYGQVIFTGCGSPHYIALAVAALAREQSGLVAQGMPASEVWLNPRASYAQDRRTMLVALSRSGETTEVLHACEAFRKRGQGEIVTLSCYPNAMLPKAGDLNILLAAGQEKSLAQTRAFTTLYLAAVACVAIWMDNDAVLSELTRLPHIGRRVLVEHAPIAHALGSDPTLDRFYFLGSGPRYGLACEMSLKMKEMSLSHSEPFHFLEFRHGPQSMVNENTLVVGLVSEANAEREMAVLNDVRKFGGRVLSIGEHLDGMDRVDGVEGVDGIKGVVGAHFDSGLSEAARNVLYLPVGQMLALERALSKGLNPDQPNQLTAYVKL
jgi:glucosamine--fructose-6-phosphate aminotransferase (isomerizing)